MYWLVNIKFSFDKDLKQKLLSTCNSFLVEGNTWHDNYWGNCTCDKCKYKEGQNKLGKILMKFRKELRCKNGTN